MKKIVEFLKPTKLTITAFVILVLLFIWALTSLPLSIFPCKVQPVVPSPPQFKDSLCSLQTLVGVNIEFTNLGILMEAVIILIIPYLISCAINKLVAKKRKK